MADESSHRGLRRDLAKPRRRRVRATLGVLAIAMSMLVLDAPAASAHTSSYCGHDISGIVNITAFYRTLQSSPHEHEYKHYIVDFETGQWVYIHRASKVCS